MKDLPKKYTKEIEELIIRFDTLQEERVKTYNTFEEGIKNYINSGPEYDFVAYREVVSNVTSEFKRISEEIINIEKNLRDAKVIDIADIILAIQDCEKRKLQLTVEHHLSRQMVADSDGSDIEKNVEKDLRRKLGKTVEEINEYLTELRYIIYED
ncbi:UNVERIFIED_CONTAM: hypothetical protein RMT77_010910 [Armadillidium vulgare]